MSSRSILGLNYILRGLLALGEDVSPVLAEFGLDLDRLDPEARILRDLELAIHIRIAEVIKDPLSALRVGTFFGFAGYGPLTMLLATSDTVYTAIMTGLRYQGLTYLFGDLGFLPGEAASALTIRPLQLPERAYRYRVDGELSGTLKLLLDMRQSMGLNIDVLHIDIPYAAPAQAASYPQILGCQVEFGSELTRIWVANHDLQARLPSADAAAHHLYRRLCDDALQQTSSHEGDLSARISRYLGLFRGSFPSAAETARAFALQERSLRAQLARENSCFRDLLEQERMRRARQLLLDKKDSVEAIAHELGYAEAASFIHAFVRHHQTTPARFRRQTPRGTTL